ncbi:uncharacterized protein LOC114761221, partial [Neltuma alba]|uniref:uncharacterized protein LOC114761221 n=1 Tax=Neltuma alba TaxID=207710 RepID=UPI0010A45C28
MASSSWEKLEISLTLFLDKDKSKALYAEAENDFVNVLLSFLTLPLGTISGLVGKESTLLPCTFSCISSLRQSVENLDLRHFTSDGYKGKLLNPINPSVAKFKNLLYNFDDPQMSNCCVRYLRKPACFVVCDDPRVMPSDLNTTLWILRFLGIEYAPEKLTVHVTEKVVNVLDLLKFSLWSKTPLTDSFLHKKLQIQN